MNNYYGGAGLIPRDTTPPSGGVNYYYGAAGLIPEELTRSITITAPDGGEDWSRLSANDITWNSASIEGTVKIELSSDSGGTYPDTIATGETNDGTYEWTITESETTTARIKITSETDPTISGESTADFTISEAIIPRPPRTAETFIGDKRETHTFIGDGRVAETLIGDKRELHTFTAGDE